MSIRVRIADAPEPISHVSMFNHLGQELDFNVLTATLSGLTDASLREVIEDSGLEEGVLTGLLNGSFGQREGRAARRAF